jgi:hemoglobin
VAVKKVITGHIRSSIRLRKNPKREELGLWPGFSLFPQSPTAQFHSFVLASCSMEPTYGFSDTSFRAAGGEEGIRRLVDKFYDEMEFLPEARALRGMHREDLSEARDKLARFLCGWLGGPQRYQEKYGSIRIPVVHAPFAIGTADRDAWLLCMQKAVDAQPYAASFKNYLMAQLAVPAERVRNRD